MSLPKKPLDSSHGECHPSKLEEAKRLIDHFNYLKDVWLCSLNIDEVKKLMAAQDLISREEQRNADAEIFRIFDQDKIMKALVKVEQKILNPSPKMKEAIVTSKFGNSDNSPNKPQSIVTSKLEEAKKLLNNWKPLIPHDLDCQNIKGYGSAAEFIKSLLQAQDLISKEEENQRWITSLITPSEWIGVEIPRTEQQCHERNCRTRMSLGSPRFCPEHNRLNSSLDAK